MCNMLLKLENKFDGEAKFADMLRFPMLARVRNIADLETCLCRQNPRFQDYRGGWHSWNQDFPLH